NVGGWAHLTLYRWYRGRPKMGWVWRALIAALLLGGTVAVVPGIETYAAGGLNADGSNVLRPASDNDCPNSNPRKQKKCHYNNQDNVANAAWSTDSTGAQVQN